MSRTRWPRTNSARAVHVEFRVFLAELGIPRHQLQSTGPDTRYIDVRTFGIRPYSDGFNPTVIIARNQYRRSRTIGEEKTGRFVCYASVGARDDRCPQLMWFCGMWEPHGYRSEGSCHRVVIAIWPPVLANLHFPEVQNMRWTQPFITSPELRGMVRIMPAIDLAFERRDLITNVEAASVSGLSRDIFIRSFRRLMGVGFHGYEPSASVVQGALRLHAALVSGRTQWPGQWT